MSCAPQNPLPPVGADLCAPVTNFGQISKVYLANADATDFTDWTTITEWNTRMDNADIASNDAIRYLHTVGDKPRPERTEVEFSQGRKIYTPAAHTINLRVDEVNDANYALVKFLEDNAGQQVKLWYEAGDYLFGGNTGILVLLVLDDVIPESDEELETFQGEATWEGSHPERTINPMA